MSTPLHSDGRSFPYWLRQMEGWEQTPDWLYKLIEQDQDALSSLDLDATWTEEAIPPEAEPPPFQESQVRDTWSAGEPAPTSHPLPGEETVEEPAALPFSEEELPEWMINPSEEPQLELGESPPLSGAMLPEWMSGEQESEAAALTSYEADWWAEEEVQIEPEAEEPSPLVSEEQVPEWLRGLDEQEAPDWLKGLSEEPEPQEERSSEETTEALGKDIGLPEWPTEGSVSTAEEGPAALAQDQEDDTFDWLSRLKQEDMPTAEEWLTGADEDAEAPDRLRELTEEPAPKTEAPAAGEASEEAALPEWLSDLGQEPEVEDRPGFGAKETTIAAAEEELPEWLNELSEEPDSGKGSPAVEESVEAAEEGIPDWLLALAEEPRATTGEPQTETSGTGNEQSTELPEWLTDLGEEQLLEVEEPEAGAPHTERPVDSAESAELLQRLSEPKEGEVLEPPPEETEEAELPEWLAHLEEEPALEALTAEPEHDELPEWLTDLDTEQVSEAEETAEEPAEKAEWPEWFAGLEEEPAPLETEEAAATRQPGVEDETPPIAEAEIEAAPETGTADIPVDAEGMEEWISQEEELLATAAESELPEWPAEGEEALEGETPPDWLTALSQEPEPQPEQELPATPADAEGLAEWLAEEEEQFQAAFQIEGAPEETDEGELPDWLTAQMQEPEGETLEEVLAPEEEGLPEWLNLLDEEGAQTAEAEPLAADQAPDWLVALDEDTGSEVNEELPVSEDEAGLPEWLGLLEEEDTAEVVSLPATEAESPEEPMPVIDAERVEEWPIDLEVEASEQATEGAVEEGPGDSEARGEIPDKLQDPSKELPLEEELEPVVGSAEDRGPVLAKKESEPSPVGGEEELSPEQPAWMANLFPADKDEIPAGAWLELTEKEQLAEAKLPEWLEELRDQEAAEEQDQELPVETSGPLAGLRGLLNPEPILAIFPRSTYRATPPIPEAHVSEARMIQEMLSAPKAQAATVSEKTGRRIVEGLGRWIVYGLLAAVMVAAALVPELQASVRPPETPGTSDFYNAVEGLPSDSEVLLALDYDASLDGELTPLARAILWHLSKENLGVLTVGLSPQGAALAQDLFDEDPEWMEGENYLNLGYLPPHPASLQAFMVDPLLGTVNWERRDEGSRVRSSPGQTRLRQRINQFGDLDLIVIVSGDADRVRWWIEQVGSQQSVSIIAGISAAIAPHLQPYYLQPTERQLEGLLIGLAGAAKYEEMTEAQFTPKASENLIMQSYAQLVILSVVFLAGIRALIGHSKET